MSSKKIQGNTRTSPPTVEWNHTYPPPLGYSGGNCIQQTPDGGYIITGYAGWGNMYSFYLLKIDEQGNEQWNRTFGSGYTEANWVEVTDDNGYIITGRYCRWIEEQEIWMEDIWVIKTNEFGYEEWNWTRMTLYNDWGTCIKQTSDGGFITTNIASGDTYNFSLLKLDANGDVLWETIYENRWGLSFLLTPDDDIILTGLGQYALLLMKTDENGTMEWEQEFFQDPWLGCRGNDVHMTSDGGYIIGGSTSTYSAPSDLLLLKTDENGVEQWHQTYGFSGTDQGTSVALFDNGDYVIGGTHFEYEGDKFWLLRTTPTGTVIWSQFYLPLESARCSCVQQTSDGGVIASGAINMNTGATCIVLKLSNHTENQPPYTPSNPDPSDGMIDVEVNTTLSWIDSDPNPQDMLTYDVYFGINTTPPKIVSNQTELMYDPGTMEYSTPYYWRIVAWDANNESTTGPVWHFTTMPSPNQPPYPPKNPNPPDGASDVDVHTELNWQGGDPDPGDTVTYDVYFGSTDPPNIITHNQSTTECTPGELEYSTTYYWKIIAWDTHNKSTTGPVWQFTTKGNQPPEPSAISGPHYGKINTMYNFSLGNMTDPDGDILYGYWDWGDSTSGWLGPYESGQSGIVSHSWTTPGNYTIKVKLRDIYGAESGWSMFWIEIVQLRTAGYIGAFKSISQTDDLLILQGRTFLVFPALPVINRDGIIVLSKRNLGYLGTTLTFGAGGITVL